MTHWCDEVHVTWRDLLACLLAVTAIAVMWAGIAAVGWALWQVAR